MDLIVAAGERDMLTLIANGFHAICFSSETAKVPRRFTKELYEAGYNFHCLYDNDKTGRSESLRLAQSGFNSLNSFDSLNRGQRRRVKDVTDFVIGGHDLRTEVNRLLYGEAKVSEKDGDQISQIFQILQPSSEEAVTDTAFDRRIYDQLPPLMTDLYPLEGVEKVGDSKEQK